MIFLRAILYGFRYQKQKISNPMKYINLKKDYYKVLQVNNQANDTTIKKAYFRLAKKLHPDHNPQGQNQFTEIQEAYSILSDEKLKSFYDWNNQFYAKPMGDGSESNYGKKEDYRNEEFYSKMRSDGFRYSQQSSQSEQGSQSNQNQSQQSQEQAKWRKKLQEEIKLTRRMFFVKNPIWERANNYMNYEERLRRIEEKQRQLEQIFPQSTRIASSLKKWVLK